MSRTGSYRIPLADLEAKRDFLAANLPWFSIPVYADPEPIGYEKRAEVIRETETVYVTSDRIPSPIGFETVNARVARHIASIEAKALHQYYMTNKMPKLLEDVPPTLAISDWDLLSGGHVVWYDKNTGIVQCVLDKDDKVGLKFWRRYFSDLPQFVKVSGWQFARIASDTTRKVLVRNGEVIRWGTKGEIATFIVNNKNLIENGDHWEVYKRGAVFPELRWNRPSTTNLSRVAMVFALYSNTK